MSRRRRWTVGGRFASFLATLIIFLAVFLRLAPDAAADSFATINPMSTSRARFASTLLPDGTVLVTGGITTNGVITNNAQRYNPATGVWLPIGNMFTTRYEHSATLLPNGDVLVAGGAD